MCASSFLCEYFFHQNIPQKIFPFLGGSWIWGVSEVFLSVFCMCTSWKKRCKVFIYNMLVRSSGKLIRHYTCSLDILRNQFNLFLFKSLSSLILCQSFCSTLYSNQPVRMSSNYSVITRGQPNTQSYRLFLSKFFSCSFSTDCLNPIFTIVGS